MDSPDLSGGPPRPSQVEVGRDASPHSPGNAVEFTGVE